MPGTLSPEAISTKLERIATLARHRPALVLTSLAHHIDVAFLREAYRRTRKDGAVGVDGQTAEAYAANLEENLQGLLDRLKAGTYEAPPVRRVHITKAETGKTRPIGIPTFEDKILQRAVVMILEAIYEQDFLPCSYGFRQGDDARRVHAVLPKRFGKYGLTLHPEKTRLTEFHRPRGPVTRDTRPATFDLLGLTHYWGRSWRGYWVVKRQTARNRFRRAVTTAARWCQRHRHWPLGDQQRRLNTMLRGHYGYYGITGNSRRLAAYRYEVVRVWRKWLDRRSRRACMTWSRFFRVLARYPLAPAVLPHSIYRHAAKP